jgi:uncharacterized membrane protein
MPSPRCASPAAGTSDTSVQLRDREAASGWLVGTTFAFWMATFEDDTNQHSAERKARMDKVVAVVFNDEKQAYEGLRALRDLHADGSITLYSDAVVAKDAGGTLSVRQGGEVREGTFFGLLTGSLIGILGGPVGLAVGASAGTMIGATFDLAKAGIDDDFLREMSDYLLPGKTAVVTEVDEDWQAPIDTRMEALGGHVFRRNRIEIEDAYFERQIAADREELAALEAELTKASAERKARLEAKIQDTRQKLQDTRDRLKARIDSVRAEGEAKVESLQQQLKTARDDRKQRLEKRLADIRADYRERTAKLHQAWELTKSALR